MRKKACKTEERPRGKVGKSLRLVKRGMAGTWHMGEICG